MDFWNLKAFITVVIICAIGIILIKRNHMVKPACCRFFPLFVMNSGLMVAIIFAFLGLKNVSVNTIGPMLSTAFLIILYSAIVSLIAMGVRHLR